MNICIWVNNISIPEACLLPASVFITLATRWHHVPFDDIFSVPPLKYGKINLSTDFPPPKKQNVSPREEICFLFVCLFVFVFVFGEGAGLLPVKERRRGSMS